MHTYTHIHILHIYNQEGNHSRTSTQDFVRDRHKANEKLNKTMRGIHEDIRELNNTAALLLKILNRPTAKYHSYRTDNR